MEGVRTENCLRIRNYSFLERILIILRYRVKNGYGSGFSLFFHCGSGLRYRYLLSFYQCLNNLFSANFLFVFCRIFAGKVTIFYRKLALKFIFSCSVKARVERMGRPPRPLPASRTPSGVWAGGHGGHTRFLQEAGR